MTQPPTKTAKDFIEMKKQETPARPQVVPAAVADVFPRPLKTAAQSKTNGLGATAFSRVRSEPAPRATERGRVWNDAFSRV